MKIRKSSPREVNEELKPVAVDRLPRGVACDGSFHLLGTPLGCVGAKGASLKFLSSVDGPIPSRGSRVLISPFVSQAVDSGKRGLDALVLGYDRKIRLGRMDIRLLPSGFGPGSAQLEVSLRGRKTVMIGPLRSGQPLVAPCLDVPKCDLLLIDVEPADPRPPAPKRVATRMLEWVQRVVDENRNPVLCAYSRTSALEVAWILRSAALPVRACRPVFEMLRRVAPFGYSMPMLRRLDRKIAPREVIIHLPSLGRDPKVLPGEDCAVAYVGPGRTVPPWAEQGFRLGESEDRPGIVNFAKETEASTVALGPRCDRAMGQLLQRAGFEVYRVRKPDQTAFPF